MDVSCVSARADDNSTEVFSSSVPLKPETYDTIDSLNVTNIVTAIESLDTKTSIIDFTTRTDSGTINVHKVDVKEHLHNDKDPRRNEIVKEADCEKPQNTTVFDAGLQISNDSLEETKISIDLDFTETKNTVFIDEKKVCIVETEGTIDFDEAGTGNVIVLDEDKTDTDLIILDCEKSQNTIVIEAGAKTSNDMLEETKIAIDLDGTETKNTEIYEKKDAGVLETEDTIDLDEAEADKIIIDTDVIVLDGSRTNSDVIVLDGKRSDSDVIVLDGNKTDSESTIILDDDEINKFTKRLPGPNDSVIDVENDTDYSKVAASSAAKDKKKKNEYSDLYKENSLLTELIEKCLDMENTEGMSRVINRTVLVIYKNVDESYKKSDAFRKVITNTIMKLDVQPERKFSHLRYLCDELKKHKAKKRVPFITLEEGIDKEQSTSCIPPKRRKVDVIDLDDETRNDIIQQNNPTQATKHKKDYPIGKVYPPIEINDDDSSSDVLLADGDDDVILLDENNSNKENTKKAKKYKKKYKKYKQRKLLGLEKKRGRSSNRDLSIGNQNVASNIISQNNINTNLDGYSISDPGALLEPRLSVAMLPESNATSKIISQHNITNTELVNDVSNPGVLLESRTSVEMLRKLNQVRINDIETQIAYFKKRVEELEEAEVFTDNQQSPYVMCEHFKSLILNLYKELCQLTGTEVTKRHEVRLQVVPGHPEGPVRCLEEFLNANIDEDGNPPFPDMHDVIGCVYEANLKYKMHWTRSHILSEAQALFTQFGRSMQKRRQKREWKDLMSLVKHRTRQTRTQCCKLASWRILASLGGTNKNY